MVHGFSPKLTFQASLWWNPDKHVCCLLDRAPQKHLRTFAGEIVCICACMYICICHMYIYIYIEITVPISVDFSDLDPHMYSNFEYFAWRICELFGLAPLISGQYFNQWLLGGLNVIAGVDPLGDLLFFGHLGYLFDGCRVLSFAFGTGKQLWVARLGKGSEGQKSAGKWWRAMILVEMINGNHPFWENFKMCQRKPVEYFHDICGLSGYPVQWYHKWPQRTHPK